MRLARHLLPLILLALLVQPRFLLAGELKNLDQDEWMGVYVGPKKVGYMHVKIERDTFQGKPAYVKTTEVKFRWWRGVGVFLDASFKLYASEDFSPLSGQISIRESVVDGLTVHKSEKTTDADYLAMRATTVSTVDGKREEKTRDLVSVTDFRPGIMYEFGAKRLAANEEVLLCHLRFIDLLVVPGNYCLRQNVCARARISRSAGTMKKDGKTYRVYQVEESYHPQAEYPTMPTIKVYADDGRLLLITNKTGIGIVIEAREEALKALEGDMPDVRPYMPVLGDKDIPNPDRVTELKIKLVDVSDMEMAMSDGRQKAVSSADDKTIEYHIVAENLPPRKSRTLPMETAGYEKWLQEELPYVQVKDKAIQDLARQIIGSEKDAFLAASKIRAWVYGNTRNKGPLPESASGFRPATDVIKAEAGDCRARAVLYIALARAAGIPTRAVGGLVSTGAGWNGHAWVEVFVGEWLALDPGRSSDWLPATYVKLFDGSIGEFESKRDKTIGSIHVIEYWPMDVTPANPLHDTAPPGSVIINEPNGTMTAFPPGTKALLVPEAGNLTYKRFDGRTVTLEDKTPGSMLVMHPGDCIKEYPPGSEVILESATPELAPAQ